MRTFAILFVSFCLWCCASAQISSTMHGISYDDQTPPGCARYTLFNIRLDYTGGCEGSNAGITSTSTSIVSGPAGAYISVGDSHPLGWVDCPSGTALSSYNTAFFLFGIPGTYSLRVEITGELFILTVPATGPSHELVLTESQRELPENACDAPGWLEMAYSLPAPNCLPPVSSRLYMNDSPTGPWIDGVINGGTIRFDGVPLSTAYYVTASAGALGDQFPITVDGDECPSLGGQPSTVAAQLCSPGRIQGTAPAVGCPVSVAVVAVNGSVSATVQWNGSNWWAEVGAGQYAVAIGSGGGACVEEYVVEVDANTDCPPLGGQPSTVAAQLCSLGRISGTAPAVGCPVSVAVVAVNGSVSHTVQWDGSNWWAEGGAGQYAVAIGSGGGTCVEEYVVEVDANTDCPPLGGMPSTQDATANAQGRISGTVPQSGCTVTVSVTPQPGGQALTVTWESATSWYAEAPAGHYNVVLSAGAGNCVEEHAVHVGGVQSCVATAQLELVVAQTIAGLPNGSVTYSLSNESGESYWMSFTDHATQEVSTSGGTTGVTINLYAGEYSVALHGTSGCVTALSDVIVPCMSPVIQYPDVDGDGYGDPNSGVPLCRVLDGHVLNSGDCNDNDSTRHNGVLARKDADGDGYGIGPIELKCPPLTDGWRPVSQLWQGDDWCDSNAALWGPIGVPCNQCPPGQINCTTRADCVCVGDLVQVLIDFNNDGTVDHLDHEALQAHFGCIVAQNPDCSLYDLDHDGYVGRSDVLLFNGVYNGN